MFAFKMLSSALLYFSFLTLAYLLSKPGYDLYSTRHGVIHSWNEWYQIAKRIYRDVK